METELPTSAPVAIPRASGGSEEPADCAGASLTSSASSSASPERVLSARSRLRRDASGLKIFLPADDLALKAILSPPLPSRSSSNQQMDNEEEQERERRSSGSSDGAAPVRLTKSKSSSAVASSSSSSTGGNLFDKLLFRSPETSRTASTSALAEQQPARAKTSAGSLVEEDLEMVNSGVVVMNTNLPPPPFANMFACDSCREDIGSLLTKGRHHCRNCGGSFCADCSAKAIVVPFRAYLDRGDQRVCDACFHRIQNFQAQVRSTKVTWGGLTPPPNEEFRRTFKLPESENPVTIFNCSLFVDITPFYGHLFLTRRHFCFQPYVSMSHNRSSLDNVDVSSSYTVPGTPRAPPRPVKVPYDRIVSLVKPQFYYINGLQVKTDAKIKFFLAEFNGLRDMCFLRLDQLIRARQQKPHGSKQRQSHHHHHHSHHPNEEMEQLSTDDLMQQAMVRRRSYKKLVAEQNTSPAAPLSSAMLTPMDSSDILNFVSQQSTVGYFDIDDTGTGRDSGEFLGEHDGTISESRESSPEFDNADVAEYRGDAASVEIDDDAASSVNCSSDDETFEPLPPDTLLDRTTILLDCDFRADVKQVFDLLWNDDIGRDFTIANLELARDVNINVGKWQPIPEDSSEIDRGFVISTENDYTMYRRIETQHPPKISFPGLPPYADCVRLQRFRLDASSQGGEKWDRFIISDIHRLRKMPFCDYFEIETRWVFSRDGKNYCHVQTGLVVNFLKATWFKSQITSSTKSESKEAYEEWAKQAIEHLTAQQQRIMGNMPSQEALSAPSRSPIKDRARSSVSASKKSSSEVEQSPACSRSSSPLATRARAVSNSAQSAIARAWTAATTPTSDSAECDDDGVVAEVRGLFTLLASSSYTQWVVLLLLFYCLMVIRSQQFQIQQLASTTATLLDKLHDQRHHPSSSLASTSISEVCQQQVMDGAMRALEQYFESASAGPTPP